MSLHRLLYPRSIAIVGASDRIGPGFNAWNALAAVGFDGEVHLINLNETRSSSGPVIPASPKCRATSTRCSLPCLTTRWWTWFARRFLEQLRKPKVFIDHCRRARAAAKPVVVLKSGRSSSGQRAVMAHTGAVAGSAEVSDAVLRAAGAVQVDEVEFNPFAVLKDGRGGVALDCVIVRRRSP